MSVTTTKKPLTFIPSHLIDSEGNLLSHVFIDFNNLDKYGYPRVGQSNRYRVYPRAPKLATTGNYSTNVAITSEGELYDLFKREALSLSIIHGVEVIAVFDLDHFDFALLDSRGRLIEVVNFRHSEYNEPIERTIHNDLDDTPHVTYRIVAEGVKMVVPHQPESRRYAFLDAENKWQSRRPYTNNHSPILGSVQPKLEEIVRVTRGFIFTKTGLIAISYPTSTGLRRSHGAQSAISDSDVYFQLLGEGIVGVSQYNAVTTVVEENKYGDRVKKDRWLSITHILKSDGTVLFNKRPIRREVDHAYPPLDSKSGWIKKTFLSPTKFTKMSQFDNYTLLVDENNDVCILNRRDNRFSKYPGLKDIF